MPRKLLLAAAVLSATVIAVYREAEVWTPLQRRYLWSYAWSGLAFTGTGSYELLQVAGPKGSRLALDDEIVTVTTATGETSFAPSAAAVKAGATRVAWERQLYDDAALHAFLGRWIYQDHSLLDLAKPSLWGAFAVFLGGVIGAVSQAVTHARASCARHPVREVDWRMVPPVSERMDGPLPQAPSVPAAADLADAPAPQHALAVPWADAYFK